MTTGDRIAQKRKENNLTQEELAYRLGVSRQAVSGWENGLNYPETEKLIAMSELFEVTVDWLLNGREENAGRRTWYYPHFSYQSKKKIGNLPLVCVGKNAKGIIAVGLTARGVIAIGLLPIGLFAVGVLPIALFAVGSIALGLVSAGGIAIGGVAFGGVAVGILSFGGLSVGIGAIGGAAFGQFARGGYANGVYLAIGDVAVGNIALGTTKATGRLYSLVAENFSAVYGEVAALLKEQVPPLLKAFEDFFLSFLL